MKKRPMLVFCMGFILIMLVSGVLNTPAYGHKVMVFAYEEEGLVMLEGYFADGKMAQDSLVEVFGQSNNKLLEGRTDENGSFSFPMPKESELRIVLTASMGHRAECTVKGKGDEEIKPDQEDAFSSAESGREDAASAALSETAEERIRSIVSEELDRKLAPLMHEMALLRQDRPSLTEIIGGIGYIAGIMGLIMYFKTRRKSEP